MRVVQKDLPKDDDDNVNVVVDVDVDVVVDDVGEGCPMSSRICLKMIDLDCNDDVVDR